ncbi:hypothetical protein N566_25190 [Streptomycetaceae bacterium MP113-05]|nr:hypothetical protein N566_25190 [Streptomycetaceae bacterium MP113-05]
MDVPAREGVRAAAVTEGEARYSVTVRQVKSAASESGSPSPFQPAVAWRTSGSVRSSTRAQAKVVLSDDLQRDPLDDLGPVVGVAEQSEVAVGVHVDEARCEGEAFGFDDVPGRESRGARSL